MTYVAYSVSVGLSSETTLSCSQVFRKCLSPLAALRAIPNHQLYVRERLSAFLGYRIHISNFPNYLFLII